MLFPYSPDNAITAAVETLDLQALPDDVGELKRLIVKVWTEAEKRTEVLSEEVRLLQDKLFGRRAENWSEAELLQMRLFNEAESDVAAEAASMAARLAAVEVAAHSRGKSGRRPLPASLPRVDIVHDISEGEKLCGCGAAMVKIDEETHERLGIVPQKVYVERHIRPKYACRKCGGAASEGPAVKIAPLPPAMIPKSNASEGLLAYLLTAKFCDALPLYRQERIFARFGIDITRATMCSWVLEVGRRCEPLMGLLRDEIRAGPLVWVDETPLQVLKEPGRAATTKSYMWVFAGGGCARPTAVVYLYHPTRSASVPQQYLQGFHGYMQTDGYTAYDEMGRQPGIRHLGCWAHSRRKWIEVTKVSKNAASAHVALGYIKMLYKVEANAAAQGLDAEGVRRVRQEQTLPVLTEFKSWLDERVQQVPPHSLLGKAFAYTLGQWERLVLYLEDGRLTPDNNIAENAIRPFCVGRRNWLFSYHPAGAAASATIYSLIESAKLNGLEPYWYLRTVFERLPLLGPNAETDKLRALLPQYLNTST